MNKNKAGLYGFIILVLVITFFVTKQEEKASRVILLPNPLVLEIKNRHFAEIERLEKNLALQMEATYDLALIMESWANLWSGYKSVLDSRKIVELEEKKRIRVFGQKTLHYIELYGLDLPEKAKQNLEVENDSKTNFDLLLSSIEDQLENQYGSSHRQLYLLIFTQTHAIVCLGNMEVYAGSVENMVKNTNLVLSRLALELGVYPDLKEKFEELEGVSAGTLLNKGVLDIIIEISDILFSTILSNFEERDRGLKIRPLFYLNLF